MNANTPAELLAILQSGKYNVVEQEYTVVSVTPFTADEICKFVGKVHVRKDDKYSTTEKPRYQFSCDIPAAKATIYLDMLRDEANSLPEEGKEINKEDLFKVVLVKKSGKKNKQLEKYTSSKEFIKE